MFEEIKNRIAYLTQTKKEIQDLYLLSNDEIEQTGLSERNMQISMELSFLNKLLQYDVSGRSELLFCSECGGAMYWNKLYEKTQCINCGGDLAK